MALLTVDDIHLRFDDRPLLQGISLVVEDGERIGLVGPNGCGKSTLLSILAGDLEPDAGERTVRRGLRLGYMRQDPSLPAGTTVHEAVAGGLGDRATVLAALDRVHERLAAPDLDPTAMESLLEEQQQLDERLERLGGHDVDHRVDAMLADLGLSRPDARCDQLSGGQRRRAALARLLMSRPDLILLDEPTNHLDAQVIAWLEDFLVSSGQPLVMVTHDRYFLDRVVDRIVEIDRGRAHAYDGGYQDFVVQRAARLEREQKEERTRQNLMRREIAWMRRGPPARTTKSKSRLQRAQALVDAVPDEQGDDLEFRIPPGPRLGTKVLELHGVTKSFGDLEVVRPVDLEIRPGDRLGIIGPNGAGKTTLLNLCLGKLQPDAGEVVVGPTVRFAEIDQSRTDLDPTRTVVEEVGGGNDYVDVGGHKLRIETFLDTFLFPGPMKQARIGSLSGGERNRVLLAKLLSAGGNVLVLDEPTNDLDLVSLRTLEEALVAFPGVVLCVSHDRWFLDRVATRVLLCDGSGSVRIHEGDLSLLLERLAAEGEERRAREREAARKEAARGPSRTAGETGSTAAPTPRKLGSRERRELEELPSRIETAEERLGAIDRELGDPALYTGPDAQARVDALNTERARLQDEVARMYARWEELDAVG